MDLKEHNSPDSSRNQCFFQPLYALVLLVTNCKR